MNRTVNSIIEIVVKSSKGEQFSLGVYTSPYIHNIDELFDEFCKENKINFEDSGRIFNSGVQSLKYREFILERGFKELKIPTQTFKRV